mgnify:CR=1 FL=1
MSLEKDTEYTLRSVPLSARLTLVSTVLLWSSLTLDPSAPYLAMWWASAYPFAVLITATLTANVILSAFSSLSGYIASKEGLTYALATEKVYGVRGSVIPALWAGFVAVGWLAFSIGVVADVIVGATGLPGLLYYVVVVFSTLLFTVTAYLGVKHIVRLAMIGVPLLVILITAGVVLSVRARGLPPLGEFDISSYPVLASLVLGTFVNGSIVLSFDYQRFCRRPVDAVLTAVINFLVFWSFIILVSAVPAATLGKDLIAAYVALGLTPLAIITLFLLAWTSADNQLYSTSLSWTLAVRTLGRVVDRRRVVLIGTILTMLLASIKLHVLAVQWLTLMTVVSLPAGIVLWTDYFVVCRRRWSEVKRVVNLPAFISWLIGSITIYYLNFVVQAWYGTLLGFLVTSVVYVISSSLTR